MVGKILKIASNDVYGNVDERRVVAFSCFEHTKYMNNYVIFCFEDEYNKNKLYYGSVHLKNESIVVFSVKDNIKEYIDEFLNEYENNKVENFKLLDISNMEKIELVSYNEMDYDKLQLLDDKSIIREVKVEPVKIKESKPIFLYIIIILLVLSAIGITLLYLYPDMFAIKHRKLLCSNNLYDNDMKLYYDIDKDIKFDNHDKVDSIDVIRTYIFLDSKSYYEFKDNDKHLDYFNNGEGYKYIDEGLQFRVFYQESIVIDDYDEMFVYLNREGFNCIESEYEK